MDKPAAHSDARLGQSQFYVLHSSKKQKHKFPDVRSERGNSLIQAAALLARLG